MALKRRTALIHMISKHNDGMAYESHRGYRQTPRWRQLAFVTSNVRWRRAQERPASPTAMVTIPQRQQNSAPDALTLAGVISSTRSLLQKTDCDRVTQNNRGTRRQGSMLKPPGRYTISARRCCRRSASPPPRAAGRTPPRSRRTDEAEINRRARWLGRRRPQNWISGGGAETLATEH